MGIIWSEEAKVDYHENIQYLLNKWSEKVAIDFIEEVEAILDLIKLNPKLFPKVDYKSTRRAVVRKQITLYYIEKNEVVYLVRFWNNHKNPNRLDFE